MTDTGACEDDLTYTWVDYTDTSVEPAVKYYGWVCNQDWSDANEKSLALGDGWWIQSPGGTWGVNSSGQVYGDRVPVTLRSGFTLCGNPCPRVVTFGECEVTGYDKTQEYYGGDVNCQRLTDTGACEDGLTYTWVDYTDTTVEPAQVYYGWVSNMDWSDANSQKIAIGGGIYVQAPSTSWQLIFPKAISAE